MQRALFGANISQIGVDYETTKRIVHECEKYGFDFVWITDHLHDFLPSRFYLESGRLVVVISLGF